MSHRRRIAALVAALLTALAVVVPAAQANGHRQHGHHLTRHMRALCGTVDASSQLPGTLVLATKRHGNVTIVNPNNVDTSSIEVGKGACARVKGSRAADGTVTLTLVAVKAWTPRVRPYVRVDAIGAATVNADSVGVATLTFGFPTGFTFPTSIVTGDRVIVRGSIATQGAALTLKSVHEIRVRGQKNHAGGRVKLDGARIVGPLTAVTAATADAAGSIEVGGISVVVPAGRTLRANAIVGAKVMVLAIVKNGALTLGRICVRGPVPALPAA